MIIQMIDNKLCRGIGSYIRLGNKDTAKIINFGDNVYKVKFQNPQSDRFLFFYSLLNRSIIQFIEEFASSCQIYVYHDTHNSKMFDNVINVVPNYIVTNLEEDKKTIRIPYIYNNIDFYSLKKDRKIKYSCFVGSQINTQLLDALTTKQKNIAIFDYNKPNRYNLGKTTESEKNKILNQTENYIDTDGEYLVEASALGCSIYHINHETTEISGPHNYNTDHITINEFLKDIIKL